MKTIVLLFLNFSDFFYKKKLLASLKQIMKKNNQYIFDVGAHRGETVKLMYNNFDVKNIFAFEPLSENFKFLKKNTSLIFKRKKNINYYNFALGEKKEKKYIREMQETSSSTFNRIDKNTKYYKRKNLFLALNSKKKPYKKKKVSIEKAEDIILKLKIKRLDLLKIDTEGYEYNVIKGFGNKINIVDIILFEHHYDLMIKKDYKFFDIHNYLKSKNFKLKYKFKMPFRKTFEYIYINERHK